MKRPDLVSFLMKSSIHTLDSSNFFKIPFFPNYCIYTLFFHYRTLTRNIRKRRGQKVEISLPLFLDSETDPMISSKQGKLFPDAPEAALAFEPNQVYMDCMAFGMGCCCLQITFQAADMSQARFIYDQFAILSPIMVISSFCLTRH